MKRKRKPLALLFLVLLVAFVVLLYLTRGCGSPTPKQTTEESQQSIADHELGIPRLSPPLLKAIPRGDPSPDDPSLPIIDEATVEKTEVCRGEDNFINLKVHTRNGTDAFLGSRFKDPSTGIVILGGNRIPFRLDKETTEPMVLSIEGNMVSKMVSLPPVHVKDCDAPRLVNVHVNRTMAARDRVDLVAELVEHAPNPVDRTFEPLVPDSYEWDFGDGEKRVVPTAEIEHSYEARDQSVRQSSFLISVTIRDLKGQQAHGSIVVAFPNVGFGPLYFKKQVVMSIGVKEAQPGSTEHERIWIYHGYKEQVRIDSVSLIEKVSTDGEKRETFRRSYSPEEVLGLSEVMPRQSSSIRDLTDLQPTNANAVRYVELEGVTSDGKRAVGSFTLLPAGGVPKLAAPKPNQSPP